MHEQLFFNLVQRKWEEMTGHIRKALATYSYF